MSSYHTSFNYKDNNSFDEGYIIVAFEPDNGFKDTFLAMENISDNYYDGTKRFDYSAKYSSQSEVKISIIKKDGTDMSVKDFRNCAKWLTGARTNTWLDMCVGEVKKKYIGDGSTQQYKFLDSDGSPLFGLAIVKIDNKRVNNFTYDYKTGILLFDTTPIKGSTIDIVIFPPIYSFLGKFLNLEQYKLDGRTIGARLTFSSVSPWAYSKPHAFDCDIGQLLYVNSSGVLTKDRLETEEDVPPFIVNDDGMLYLKNEFDADGLFNIVEDSIADCDVSNFLAINFDGRLIKNKIEVAQSGAKFGVDNYGIMFQNHIDKESYFDIVEKEYRDGYTAVVVGIDTSYKTIINNESDDLYTYINLDIDYESRTADSNLSILNVTLEEEAKVLHIRKDEKISISANQFIVSSDTQRIFGTDFNFVWPRLQPGINEFVIGGGGTGTAYFTYRYPMKIGDCAMDIDINGNGIFCRS